MIMSEMSVRLQGMQTCIDEMRSLTRCLRDVKSTAVGKVVGCKRQRLRRQGGRQERIRE